MLTLGIETSCDDTAAAVLKDCDSLLSSVISSQDQIHTRFGGVVPELASRTHLESIVPIVREALDRACVTLKDIDLISVTQGPGLIGSLLVGFSYAKALSYVTRIPLVGVDHMAGHLLAVFLEEDKPAFPYIALIVSGGTSSIYLARSHTSFSLLGRTRDDAAGEAFDKVAKLLGLPYPGGPRVSAEASSGNSAAIKFPRAWLGRSLSIHGSHVSSISGVRDPGPSMACASTTAVSLSAEEDSLDFSFSGLKTSVLNHCNQSRQAGIPLHIPDICASFQEAIVEVLVEKTVLAARKHNIQTIVLGGGVSANPRLRESMSKRCQQEEKALFVPRPSFCTDNGAMIALAGFYYARDAKTTSYDQDVYSRSQL
ncbi:MAG: tRNA (adenosine(37)-N6)-threonylcarbamoyltransferase complex transferase subunit TsaD [Desulfoarculaceae bacterium]|nr:tRNA (adenosine(37)-N6)-threonylcarbamoyltransferase complex transferase subunit TsaD [Desulfoarculaceae bacterium]